MLRNLNLRPDLLNVNSIMRPLIKYVYTIMDSLITNPLIR